ncbi:MAG: DUF2207 domain-containing protein, partial [Clostridiales bacterium]|nr:DUF2207 domain-containing protein [Clostridiales bacterium]
MSRKRIVFIALAALFVLSFLPVVLLDLELMFFGEGCSMLQDAANYLFFGLLAAWVMVVLFYYVAYAREYRVTYKEAGKKPPPFSYSPAVMMALTRPTGANKQGLAAVAADLYRKGAIEIAVDGETGGCLRRAASAEIFASHENFLLRWLFNDFGDGGTVQPDVFAAALQEKNTTAGFLEKYGQWRVLVQKDVEAYRFFFDYRRIRCFGQVIGGIFAGVGLGSAYLFDKGVFFIFFFLGLLFFSYSGRLYKRTRTGQAHFEQWMAYIRFLKMAFVGETVAG